MHQGPPQGAPHDPAQRHTDDQRHARQGHRHPDHRPVGVAAGEPDGAQRRQLRAVPARAQDQGVDQRRQRQEEDHSRQQRGDQHDAVDVAQVGLWVGHAHVGELLPQRGETGFPSLGVEPHDDRRRHRVVWAERTASQLAKMPRPGSVSVSPCSATVPTMVASTCSSMVSARTWIDTRSPTSRSCSRDRDLAHRHLVGPDRFPARQDPWGDGRSTVDRRERQQLHGVVVHEGLALHDSRGRGDLRDGGDAFGVVGELVRDTDAADVGVVGGAVLGGMGEQVVHARGDHRRDHRHHGGEGEPTDRGPTRRLARPTDRPRRTPTPSMRRADRRDAVTRGRTTTNV